MSNCLPKGQNQTGKQKFQSNVAGKKGQDQCAQQKITKIGKKTCQKNSPILKPVL